MLVVHLLHVQPIHQYVVSLIPLLLGRPLLAWVYLVVVILNFKFYLFLYDDVCSLLLVDMAVYTAVVG